MNVIDRQTTDHAMEKCVAIDGIACARTILSRSVFLQLNMSRLRLPTKHQLQWGNARKRAQRNIVQSEPITTNHIYRVN